MNHKCKHIVNNKIFKPVISYDNVYFKKIKKVIHSSKFRRTEKLSWIEGEKLCLDYLKVAKNFKEILLVVDEKISKNYLCKIINQNNLQEINFICLSSNLYSQICQTSNSSKWGFIVCHPKQISKFQDHGDKIVVDGIQDPGNLGNILRSAAGFGIKDFYITKNTVDIFSPKVIRAGCGAQFIINYKFIDNLEEFFLSVNFDNNQILATYIKSKSENLFNLDLNEYKFYVWIFGSEGKGLTSSVIKKFKPRLVRISHCEKINSLNVASAVSICLFEMVRQRNLKKRNL